MTTPIQNAQGMTVQELRNEIDRGGRLLVYFYCLSVLFASFKRVSKVHLIRSGSIRASASWPYNFLSLLCGWWALPFGVRYSFESLKQNLAGGLDVTDSWLAAASGMDPHAAAAEVAISLPRTESPTDDADIGFSVICGVLILALLAFQAFCYYQQQHIPVVLVNGLEQVYEIRLNQQSYLVPAQSHVLLELPKGSYKVHAELNPSAVLMDESCKLKQSVFNRQVTFINPDRLALVYLESVEYSNYANDDDRPWIEINPNQTIIAVKKTDYLLTDFPETLQLLNKHSERRSRLAVAFPSPEEAVQLLMTCDLRVQRHITQKEKATVATTYLAQYQKLYPHKSIDLNTLMALIKDLSDRPEDESYRYRHWE